MDFCGFKVGDTSFYQSPELGDWLATVSRRPIVYVKREDENEPTHTMKVRPIAASLKQYAKDNSTYILGCITCGNMGEAGVELCNAYRKKTGSNVYFASIIGKNEPRILKKKLSQDGNIFIETDLSRKLTSSDIYEIVKNHVNGKNATIVPIGGMDADGTSYKTIAKELYNNGVRNDWFVFHPVGGGESLLGIGTGFEDLGSVPKFVAATVSNSIFSASMDDGISCAHNLEANHSYVEKALNEFIDRNNVPVIVPSATEIRNAFEYVSSIKIRTSMESAVAFAAAKKYAEEHGLENGQKIAIINTGYEKLDKSDALSSAGKYFLIAVSSLLPVIFTSDINKYEIFNDLSERYYIETQKEKLESNPVMNNAYAYALWRGGMTKVDGKVLSNLEYWLLYRDNIANMMYNDGFSIRNDVDGFYRWIEEQKIKKEKKDHEIETFRQMNKTNKKSSLK